MPCNRVSVFNRFRDIRPPKPVRTHKHTPQVILYSVPCNALNWTDKNRHNADRLRCAAAWTYMYLHSYIHKDIQLHAMKVYDHLFVVNLFVINYC